MSTYVPPRRIRLRLKALNEVAKRLSLSDASLTLENRELLSCHERVDALGKTISRNLADIKNSMPSITSEHLVKTVALYGALKEQDHVILSSIVAQGLSPREKNLLDEGLAVLSIGDSRKILSLAPESDTLLNKLSDMVRSAHNRIALAEKDVIMEKTQDVLNALGYDVRVKSRRSGTLLRGMKNDLSIAADVSETGELSIDMAGFEGGACSKELDLFMGKLKDSGIMIQHPEGIFHGKKEGGVLAQEAAKEIPFNPLKKDNRRQLLAMSRQRTRIQR